MRVALTIGAGLSVRDPAAALAGDRSALGRGGTDGVGGRGGLGGVHAAAAHAECAHRARRACPRRLVAKLWGAAAVGAAVAWGIKLAIGRCIPSSRAAAILVPYGLTYFAVTWLLRVEECAAMFARVGLRRLGGADFSLHEFVGAPAAGRLRRDPTTLYRLSLYAD